VMASSKGVELVNPAGLRLDGRRVKEHRPVNAELSIARGVDGSCRYQSGGTTVVAYVSGPRSLGNRQVAGNVGPVDEATILCEVGYAAFAGERRRNAQRRNRRTEEIGSTVVSALSSVVFLNLYPNCVIQIFLEILQHDGSERSACINAVALAMADANIAMRDLPSAVTVGFIREPTVDLTAIEARSQTPSAVVVIAGHRPTEVLWLDMETRAASDIIDALVKQGLSSAEDLYEKYLAPQLKASVVEAIERRGAEGFIHQANPVNVPRKSGGGTKIIFTAGGDREADVEEEALTAAPDVDLDAL
jgi:exosome complex component RRP41